MAGTYVSREGLDKMVAELKQLETVERPAISAKIGEARDKGDLSENAEYDAAKEAQGILEGKISILKAKIAGAVVLDKSKLSTDKVQILNKVTIRNTKNNQTMTYTIVSESEQNLKEMKMSIKTPIAQALLGKKVGDAVDVKVPAGIIPFEIVKIEI